MTSPRYHELYLSGPLGSSLLSGTSESTDRGTLRPLEAELEPRVTLINYPSVRSALDSSVRPMLSMSFETPAQTRYALRSLGTQTLGHTTHSELGHSDTLALGIGHAMLGLGYSDTLTLGIGHTMLGLGHATHSEFGVRHATHLKR